jgi:3-dehydroquinate synthetase
LLNDVLCRVGKLPDAQNINLEKVTEAFAFDKKTTGSSLQWILLKEIGKPVIVESKDIATSIVYETLEMVLHRRSL